MKTAAQLNAAIAQRKGWTVRKDDRGEDIWTSPTGETFQLPPAYDRDWRRAGPLLQEMVNELGHHKALALVAYEMPGGLIPIIEAISRAWDAWKEDSE